MSRTSLYMVTFSLLERGVSILNSQLFVKDIKELSDKVADRVNSFGIYTSFEEDLEEQDNLIIFFDDV